MLLKFLKMLLTWAVLATVLSVAAATGWVASSALSRRPPADRLHSGLTVQRLSEFSELTTLRVEVSDVLVSRIDGYVGGVSAVLLVKGDVDLNVDLNKAKLKDLDEGRHTAMVVLPPPRVSRPRVDHSRTRLISINKDGLWMITPGSAPYGAVTDKAMAESQALIAGAADGQEVDARSRRHVEDVVASGCRTFGWTVCVEWSDRRIIDSGSSTAPALARS